MWETFPIISLFFKSIFCPTLDIKASKNQIKGKMISAIFLKKVLNPQTLYNQAMCGVH